MQKVEFTFFNDPGHAWLQVPKTVLVKSGVSDQISGYSYQDENFAYLEEDCDAGKFLRALQGLGVAFLITEHFTDDDSPIRGYPRYQGNYGGEYHEK